MSKFISSNQFWDNIQKEFSPNIQRKSGKINIDQDFGNITINYFSTGIGINYSICTSTFYDDTILEGLYGNDISFLLFNTGNNVAIKSKNDDKQIEINSSSYYNGNQYEGHKQKGLYSKNKQYTFHYLLFDNNLCENFINKNQQQNKPIFINDQFSLNFGSQISQKQKILLEELSLIDQIDSKLQEIYFESKILDLTYNSINDINKPKVEKTIPLSTQDIESLKKAKKILLEDITNPPSLKELAYKSAINEFKLKKGFKQLFGTTVYGLLQEYRLNKAKNLLENNEINIGEAALIVGYKNIGHFSSAFKSYFGISPIYIKKEQKKYYM